MKLKKNGATEQKVYALAAPLAESLGLVIWDVRFEKEGASWYLRVFIDKDEGISIDDCEAMSRPLSDLLDEADPIDQQYFLEVAPPDWNGIWCGSPISPLPSVRWCGCG